LHMIVTARKTMLYQRDRFRVCAEPFVLARLRPSTVWVFLWAPAIAPQRPATWQERAARARSVDVSRHERASPQTSCQKAAANLRFAQENQRQSS
jgi:hypothetical protein